MAKAKKKATKTKPATSDLHPVVWGLFTAGEWLNWAAAIIWLFVGCMIVWYGASGVFSILSTVLFHGSFALAMRWFRQT